MSRIKTVLFDLDDTIFDHLHSASSALAHIQPNLPRFADRPLADLEAEYTVLLEEIHLRVLSGELDLDKARHLRMSHLMSTEEESPSEDATAEVARLFRESYQRNRRVVRGTEELLTELRERKITIGIVTNNQTREQEEKLAFLGLDRLVDFMVTSEEVGSPKPEPHIFHIALERAVCAADEAVMVGDSWNSDIVGASNAGIRAVWYNPRCLPRPDSLPVEEIYDLEPTSEVVPVLLGA